MRLGNLLKAINGFGISRLPFNSDLMPLLYGERHIMKSYIITFEENGSEYTGWICVTCNNIEVDWDHGSRLFADGVKIEIDEKIIEIRDKAV